MFGILLVASSIISAYPQSNPWRLNVKQFAIAEAIIDKSLENGLDPMHLLSIGWAESNFTNGKRSRTNDFGVMQINCNSWYEKLGHKSWRECARRMMDLEQNIDAAIFVFKDYQGRYKHCQGMGMFVCYNGGPRWWKSKKKHKVLAYDKRVRDILYRLKCGYGSWINSRSMYVPQIVKGS